MKTIEREHFEFWLFSQPPEREFDYGNVDGQCAVCSFIRETTNWKDARGGSDHFGVQRSASLYEFIHIPEWLKRGNMGVLAVEPLTIANMQKRYLELFPECDIEVKDQPKAAASPAANQATP